MKKQMTILTIAAVLMIPAGVMAMDHGDHNKSETMKHDMKDMDHGKKWTTKAWTWIMEVWEWTVK